MEVNIKDKFRNAVIKRKATMARKRELKKNKEILNAEKKILKAAYSFSEEKGKASDKFKLKDDVFIERPKRKYERNLNTTETAINNMF